jgi:inner membrane protein
MYQPGHCGVALAFYAPIGCALVATGSPTYALLGGVVTVALTMIPDLDTRTPRLEHRGPTHSVAFAGTVGVLTALAGGFLGGVQAAQFGLLVGTLAIVSHLLADVITPMGVRPFWPLSERNFTLDIVPASDTRANVLLFVLGLLSAGGAWTLGHLLG